MCGCGTLYYKVESLFSFETIDFALHIFFQKVALLTQPEGSPVADLHYWPFTKE